ncbi:MAG: hypothetical protein RL637_467 [Pseudomonadota bacterium]|jgi:hypothetical protein
MKILSKILLLVVLATAGFSTSVIANEAKKEVVSVKAILETTLSHIDAAAKALENNEKAEVVIQHIKEARQAQKDITVGALDLKRQKASTKLINVTRDLKEGKINEAKQSLAEAKAAYEELLTLSESK